MALILDTILTLGIDGDKLTDSFAETITIVLGWITIWNVKKSEILDGTSTPTGSVEMKSLLESVVAMTVSHGTTTICNAEFSTGLHDPGQDGLDLVSLEPLFSFSLQPAVVAEFAVLLFENS